MRREYPSRIGAGVNMQIVWRQESWGEFFRRINAFDYMVLVAVSIVMIAFLYAGMIFL